MDRNSAIGLTLMALLLFGYFYFFSPSPEPQKNTTTKIVAGDSAKNKSDVKQEAIINSTVAKQYGDLGSFLQGKEEFVSGESDVLKVTFSNHGTVSEVNLKNYKTYYQKPLYLAKDGNNKFALVAMYNGKLIDLYQLYYQSEISKEGDSTKISFTSKLADNAFIKHIYSIPAKGYQVGYRIETKGVSLAGKDLAYSWIDNVQLTEKEITDSRNRTTINYYTADGSFDGLSEASADTKSVADPLKWISIRQKFFVSSILTKGQFSSTSLAVSFDAKDLQTVKKAEVNFSIPSASLASGKADFTYYFGPNDYRILNDVTEGFSRNVYLGWPPVIWVNKFLVMPIFNFLQNYISNYGVIILLLVLFMKLLLTPLTYSSYMGMAKMRLLKPELDAIKEKNGDNMTQAQQDQMKLYQQAGVNPFAGCIPLLLQFPILISIFYLFQYTIDLRQKPFLWAEDLSTYDSILNLPFSIPFYGSHISLFVLLMTASSIIYQWQNNQLSTVEGPMKSMGYITPVIFMFVLNSFSAGLSYYYFISNLITFAQQAIIKRFVDETKIKSILDENRKKHAAGTSKKSPFMAKLQDAMKASEAQRKAKK
jgi:YidC/Oxa1 family membrane protein insertase